MLVPGVLKRNCSQIPVLDRGAIHQEIRFTRRLSISCSSTKSFFQLRKSCLTCWEYSFFSLTLGWFPFFNSLITKLNDIALSSSCAVRRASRLILSPSVTLGTLSTESGVGHTGETNPCSLLPVRAPGYYFTEKLKSANSLIHRSRVASSLGVVRT